MFYTRSGCLFVFKIRIRIFGDGIQMQIKIPVLGLDSDQNFSHIGFNADACLESPNMIQIEASTTNRPNLCDFVT